MIAQVEQFPEFESGVADGIFLDVELKSLPILLQVRESGLAHQPDGHDASRDAHVDAGSLQVLSGFSAIGSQNLRDRVTEVVLMRIGGLSESFDFLQLLAPDFVDVFVE